MNILFITNLVPWPLDSGGKIKTYMTLKTLSKSNTIDLLCFYEKEDIEEARKELKSYCRNVVMQPIRVTTSENKAYMVKVALKSLLLGKSFGIYKYFVKQMTKEINLFLAENKYDIVYFDHLQLYQYKNGILNDSVARKYVLDMHNCETAIFSRRAKESKNPIKRKYLEMEADKLGKFEKWAIQDADKLILLSKEDKAELEKLTGKELSCNIIPIGVREPERVKTIRNVDNKTLNVLFVGTLTWAPNNDGMIWFFENVMSNVSKLSWNYNFYVVGKGASERLRNLAEQYENVTITGYVDSVDDYYEKCDFMVVPLFFGSGQRVKIIEGMSRGMPIISTSIGAEGLRYSDEENILIADEKEGFLKSMEKMQSNDLRKKLSEGARMTYKKYYSEEAIGKMLSHATTD